MKQITIKWWDKCLADQEKLEHWLVALYNNEKDAQDRFINFARTFCEVDSEEYNNFMRIASEEEKHAELVEEVLKKRGIAKYEKSSNNGRYFRNTLRCIHDKKSAAAIGAYAETLSLNRMRVIIEHANTPDDLRKMFEVIEPEESNHAKILSDMATKHGMKEMKHCHERGLEELGLKIKK